MHIRLTNARGRSCPSLDQQNVYFDRWRRAAFISIQWSALQDMASGHLPRLAHAKITLGSPHGEWGREVELAPNLYGRPSFFANAPYLPLQPCLEILSECPSSLTEPPLVVFGFGASSVQRLLDWSAAPHLAKLELWAIPLPSLLPFLERSQCRLTSLSLTVSVFWVSASEIRTLLGVLQDLDALTFDYCTETDESWDPHSEAETMSDILESLADVLNDIVAVESDVPLPRLAEFHFLCKERCNIRCVYVFLYRCGVIQSERTKELWVETPLNPADVAGLRALAHMNRVEIYGLDKCTAMYEALPAWDWEPAVVPSSRRDDSDDDLDDL